MFTYCNNNPVMRIDHNGQFSLEEWWNGISEGVGDFLEEAADEIEEAWDTVVDTYEDIYDTVCDGFETVTDAVSDFASDSWDFVVSYVTDPVQTTKDVYDAFVTAPFWDTPGGRISKATLNGCVIGAIGRASTVAVVSLATAPPTGGISLTAIGVAAVEGAVEGAIVALFGALAHELYN